jgi:osmotically inducible lipoprotein OsmB
MGQKGNIMKKSITAVFLITILGTLSACGHDPGERALSGAGIGAGAGAVGAILLDANPLAGAVIGGAAGAATGAFTSPHQINLDRH